MFDRLSALEASLLYLEEPATPRHVGAVSVFRRPRSGFDYDRLVALVEQRIGLVPRYRQKVREIPGWFARPVWVDDAEFDITYHVRRSALPRPGSDTQLHELVARLMSRPLEHTRPLWEIHLVEGLARNRIAVITKTHQVVTDAGSTLDIGQVILDVSSTPRDSPEDLWMPRPEPSGLELVWDAVGETVARPREVVENIRTAAVGGLATVRKAAGAIGGVAAAVRTSVWPASGKPLNVPVSAQRRFAVARTRLQDYRAVRAVHGGDVDEVVLAVVSGALRNVLLSRGEPVQASTTVRVIAAQSVGAAPAEGDDWALANRVASCVLDLPVGEPDPAARLQQVNHAMRAHEERGQPAGAEALGHRDGVARPALHSLGARIAGTSQQRLSTLVVTNVPGPQFPLYSAGAKMLEMYPVVPLVKNQAVSVGVVSYHGMVYYGLNADRDAMADVDVLAGLIEESLEELLTTVPA